MQIVRQILELNIEHASVGYYNASLLLPVIAKEEKRCLLCLCLDFDSLSAMLSASEACLSLTVSHDDEAEWNSAADLSKSALVVRCSSFPIPWW